MAGTRGGTESSRDTEQKVDIRLDRGRQMRGLKKQASQQVRGQGRTAAGVICVHVTGSDAQTGGSGHNPPQLPLKLNGTFSSFLECNVSERADHLAGWPSAGAGVRLLLHTQSDVQHTEQLKTTQTQRSGWKQSSSFRIKEQKLKQSLSGATLMSVAKYEAKGCLRHFMKNIKMSVQPAVQVIWWRLYVCHSVESSSVLQPGLL